MSWHRRSGDEFQGQDLLYLTTVGAKTGQKRQSTVARFPDGGRMPGWWWLPPVDQLIILPGITTSPRIRSFTSTEVVYGVADPDVTVLPEYGVSP